MVKTSLVTQKDHNKHSSSSSLSSLDVITSTNNGISSSDSSKYKGVRKRKWGKYVSEIRLPNSRERIWLGSYDSGEKAARAFDAAQFCLRGTNAKFNFPDNPPDIPGGRSMSPGEIQVAAARYANSCSSLDSQSESLSSSDHMVHNDHNNNNYYNNVMSPCQSVSGGIVNMESESTEMPLDNVFLDHFEFVDTGMDYGQDYGLFPGFDDLAGEDYYGQHLPSVDYWQDNNYYEDISTQSSFLWNF